MKTAQELPGIPLDRGLRPYSDEWFNRELVGHPTRDDCTDPECMVCGYRDCPDHEPLHYDTDGPCPSCEDGAPESCLTSSSSS